MAVNEGMVLSGFVIEKVEELSEFTSKAVSAVHEKTGMRVFHLFNSDRENFFSFTFKTPPANSRGTAHILEHSVLSGSERFPLKDPFVHLLKGSVQTFLNAMTYPDKTAYPVGSIVDKDLFNLMLVYGDAVFFPLLKKEIFLQEGRRYEISGEPGAEGIKEISGVVYNEMKGNYSDHESLLDEYSYRTLFPDTPYQFDSGGDPGEIPLLSYEEFLDYHKTYYHPSNCRLFLYGDISTEKYLSFLEEHFLHRFDGGSSAADIPMQPRWREKRYYEYTSPLSPGEDPAEKTSIAINWMLGDGCDPGHLLEMEVLSEILFGNSGSPLTRGIIESRLGQDVSPVSGLDGQARQLVFSAGVRGSEPDRREAFEECIKTVLEELIREGISEEKLNGAIHRVEFRNREIRGGVPFGLRLFSRSIRGWLHGFDPVRTLEFAPHMENLKGRVSKKSSYFEDLIKVWLLDNPHCSVVTLRPDGDHMKRMEEAEKVFVAELDNKLGETGKKKLTDDLQSLKEFQREDDSEEAIMKLPFISLKDLPEKVEVILASSDEIDGISVFLHEMFTNGIVYLDFAFDCTALSKEYLPYLPLFASALTETGLPGFPYYEVAGEIASKTGGLNAFEEVNGLPDAAGEHRSFLYVRVKALPEMTADALSLTGKLLMESDFSNHSRLRDILLEDKNDLKSSVISRGHSYASLRAASRLSDAAAIEEQQKGVSQLFHLERVAGFAAGAGSHLEEVFRGIRRSLFTKERLQINCTLPAGLFRKVKTPLKDLLSGFPGIADPVYAETLPLIPSPLFSRELLTIPAAIGFAAMCAPGAFYNTPEHSGEYLLSHVLSTGFLWREIRMKGGAYGAGAHAAGMEGLFSFSSYRDPNPGRSLQIFSKSFTDALSELTAADLKASITGLAGKELKPFAPGTKGFVGFRRRLFHLSDELRQEKRDQLLNMNFKTLSDAVSGLVETLKDAKWVVMADEKRGREALEPLGGAEMETVIAL